MSSSNSSCLRRLWRRSSEDYSVPCANCPVRRLLAISRPVVPGDRNRARGFQSDPPAGDVAYLARDGERAELLAQDVDPAGLPSFSAVVGGTMTQRPYRLASSARPRRASSSTHRRTGHETEIRG